MKPETGETILKILQRRVPYQATVIVLHDGRRLAVRSLDGVGRDIGDEFDNFHINFEETAEASWLLLYTKDVCQIIDEETGGIIFDASR